MKISLNFEVSSQPKKNGTYPIYLRITENGRHIKKALNVYVVNRNNFQAQASKNRNWISAKEVYCKVFNDRLSEVYFSVHKMMLSLERKGELTARNLMGLLNSNNNCESFSSFIEQKRQEYRDNKQFSCADSILNLNKKLYKFTKKRDVLFNDMNSHFIHQFVKFLSKEKKRGGKSISKSTMSYIIGRMKSMYKLAVKEGLIQAGSDPFIAVNIKKDSVRKVGLTMNELERINSLDLEPQSSLWHTRNYFMFAFYAAGMRIGDLIRLKWENVTDDRVIYCMKKTNCHISIQKHKNIVEILSLYKKNESKSTDYIFPILNTQNISSKVRGREQEEYIHRLVMSKAVAINVNLKKIALLAKIEKNLSAHIARHTFATFACQKGINVKDVSDILGHCNVAVTANYLRNINQDHQDQCFMKIFE